MRTFDDYTDGELVYYLNGYREYEAFKSKYTHNAFRLKHSSGEELVADITEITPIGERYEKSNRYLQPGSGPAGLYGIDEGFDNSNYDASGIFDTSDPFSDVQD